MSQDKPVKKLFDIVDLKNRLLHAWIDEIQEGQQYGWEQTVVEEFLNFIENKWNEENKEK